MMLLTKFFFFAKRSVRHLCHRRVHLAKRLDLAQIMLAAVPMPCLSIGLLAS